MTALPEGASVLLDACLERALLSKRAKGKTEAIVAVRSHGVRTVRKAMFGDDCGPLSLECRLQKANCLSSKMAVDGTGIAQAWDAFRRRKRQVFGCPLVPLADKSFLFESLFVIVLFYGAVSLNNKRPHLPIPSGTWHVRCCAGVAHGHRSSPR